MMKSKVLKILVLIATVLVANFVYASENQGVTEQDILGIKKILNKDILSAKQSIDKYLTVSGLTLDKRVDLLVLKSITYIYEGEYKEALRVLAIAEKSANRKKQIIKIYQYQQTAYIGLQDYPRALFAAQNQLEQIQYIDDISIQVSVYSQLLNVFNNVESYDQVFKYADKLKKISNGKYKLEECKADLFLATGYKLLNDFVNAKNSLNSIIDNCDINLSPVLHGLAFRVLGEMEVDNQKYLMGIEYLERARKIYKRFSFQYEIINVKVQKGKAYLGLNDLKKATELAQYVVALPESNSLFSAKKTAHQVLGKIALRQKDYQQAYYHSQREQFYHKFLYDDDKAKKLAVEAAKFNFEELERDLMFAESRGYMMSGLELKHRQQIQSLESNDRYSNMLMFTLVGLFLGSWAIGVAVIFQSQKDRLTGLPKTTRGESRGLKVYRSSNKAKQGFGIAVVELDNIMPIKDHYGEHTGNQVIKDVAHILKKAVGKGKVYREDFNRFYVYFLLDEQQQVVKALEQTFSDIKKINAGFKQMPFQVSVSIGYELLERGLDKSDFYNATAHASMALEEAKILGGNKLIPYSEDIDRQCEDYKRQMRFVQFIDPKLMGPAGKLSL
ncbi:GGDEF domain-containing protein [Parashewanella tropica]|uniref:GGDEF domain-containing protein n=1 Tax=Parashewanella tropica TaxID=2547970 RepID=UPI001059634C|nr:GGDEF domain-containing protein [Parashewanella tropica]